MLATLHLKLCVSKPMNELGRNCLHTSLNCYNSKLRSITSVATKVHCDVMEFRSVTMDE